MTLHDPWYRFARPVAAAAAVLLFCAAVAGCNDEVTGHEVYDVASEMPPDADRVDTRSYAGSLPKPIENYTAGQGPREFLRFVRSRSWKGWDRRRRCVDSSACRRGAKPAWMRSQAIEDSYKVRIADIPTKAPNGVIIGRLMNVGRYRDSTTGVPPNTGYTTEYYFLLNRVSNNAARIRVAELSFDRRTGEPRIRVYTGEQLYMPCNGHSPKSYPEGDFRDCEEEVLTESAEERVARLEALDSSAAFAWFSCAEGCCSAQWPPRLRDWVAQGGG